MKTNTIAMIACAGLALAPVASAFAETGAAKEKDAVAKAWVPATEVEQQVARGGSYGGNYSTLWSLQNTFCKNVTISIFFCRRQET
ncbi:MAG: hypothetical protein AB7F98_09200 [Novosphingobium sp.]